MSDRIALIEHGVLLGEGTVAEAYRRPRSLRASELMGGRNAIPGTVRGGSHLSGLGAIVVPPGTPEGAGLLLIRHEDVLLHSDPVGADGAHVRGVVHATRTVGARVELVIGCRDALLHAETPPTRRLRVGDEVALTLPSAAVHVVPN